MVGKIYIVIFVAILGGGFTSARAEYEWSSYSLTATAGGYGSSPGQGLKLGYDITGRGMADSFGVEGVYMNKWTDRGSANLFRIDVIVPVTPRKRLVPYLAVGPGWISGGGETSFALSLALGGGVKYFVSDNLTIRGDLRDMLVSGQRPSANSVEYTVGLSWIFGKKSWPMEDLEREKVTIAEGALPSGSTSEDQGRKQAESATQNPVATEVVKTGGKPAAPPPDDREKGEKTVTAAAEKESGVATTASSGAKPQEAEHPEKGSASPGQQPNPEKAPIASGTGSDSNSRQQTGPDAGGGYPLPGVSGSAIASVVPQPSPQESLPAACRELTADLRQSRSLQEVTVGFALNKADISSVYLRQLGELAKFMRLNHGSTAEISGHSDITGPLSYNLDLSRRRSESVKRYLVKLGIAPSRLDTKGYGPCSPAASNLTPAARKKNRRATVAVTLANHN